MKIEFQTVKSTIVFLISISTVVLADVDIITKAKWNGRESEVEISKLDTPVSRIVIMHTAGAECNSLDTCSQQVLNLQHHHMVNAGFADIAYNFLVGNDGRIYEGRGWDIQGAFARGYNAGSLGIAFIGNFMNDLPSQAALDAAQALLETGVTIEKIKSDYKLYGHRQLSATESPGRALFENIKQWPHWSRQVV